MCNAYKHPSDCECGFGPPNPHRLEIVERVEWLDQIIGDKSAFLRALADLDFDPRTREIFFREYREAMSASLPANTLRNRLKTLIGRLEYKTEASTTVCVHIPLFRFYTPCEGSKVWYKESLLVGNRSGWRVTLQGTGMGTTRELVFRRAASYHVEYDKYCQVFLPLDVNVELVGVFDKAGNRKGRGLRAEVKDFDAEKTLSARGCADIEPCSVPADQVNGPCDGHYALTLCARKTRVLLAKEFEVTRNLSIGVASLGFEVKMPGNVRSLRRVEIESSLPGGHNYRLWLGADALHWLVTEKEERPGEYIRPYDDVLKAHPVALMARPAQLGA